MKGVKFAGPAMSIPEIAIWHFQVGAAHLTSTIRTTYCIYSYLRIKSSEIIVFGWCAWVLVFQVSAELPSGFKIVILTEPWFCEEGHVQSCTYVQAACEFYGCLCMFAYNKYHQNPADIEYTEKPWQRHITIVLTFKRAIDADWRWWYTYVYQSFSHKRRNLLPH